MTRVRIVHAGDGVCQGLADGWHCYEANRTEIHCLGGETSHGYGLRYNYDMNPFGCAGGCDAMTGRCHWYATSQEMLVYTGFAICVILYVVVFSVLAGSCLCCFLTPCRREQSGAEAMREPLEINEPRLEDFAALGAECLAAK